jgi:TRAP-type C4-dicarboxylate transport system permease small subunit
MTETGVPRGTVDRFINAVELTAAGFLAVVTTLTFSSVILRYFFVWSIPDAYDFTRLLLGILIFWGIAIASYRGDHISVDLLWSVSPRVLKRAMDVMSALITLVGMATFTWMMATKVIGTMHDNVLTFDLRQPVWIYYLIAWLGLLAAVPLILVRTLRLVFAPESLQPSSAAKSVE